MSEATVLACQSPQVKPRKVTCPVTMSIGDKRRDVEMQVDSGASCSVLSLSVARNLFKGCRFEPTKTSLFGFGKVPLKVVGSLPVHVEYGDAAADASLYLVDTTASECIMGLDLMQALGLTIQGHGGLTLAPTVCSVHRVGEAGAEELPTIAGYNTESSCDLTQHPPRTVYGGCLSPSETRCLRSYSASCRRV